MKKRVFYTELAYVLGIITLALGTALMEKANYGMSMIVAPAYLVHLKVSQTLPFFSFGMAEYMLQAALVIVVCIWLRKVKLAFFFSFVTAVLYGLTLDGIMLALASVPATATAVRIAFYLSGMVVCALGVSFMFHTYIPPEAYELFVKEISKKTRMNINIFKTIFDLSCLAVGVALSFAFFGLWHFEGVKLGTLICALINGALIGACTKLLESRWEFKDKWQLRTRME